MKFNNFKEFWEYFSVCHFCHQKENFFLRFVPDIIESTSENILYIVSSAATFIDSENKLYLQIDFREGLRRYITETNFIIDCINNTYTFTNLTSDLSIKSMSFHTYCRFCNSKKPKRYYSIDSLDMTFDQGKINQFDIGIHHETYSFVRNKINYSFDISYGENQINFSKIGNHKEEYKNFPIGSIDFSDLKKLIKRMERLNLFS